MNSTAAPPAAKSAFPAVSAMRSSAAMVRHPQITVSTASSTASGAPTGTTQPGMDGRPAETDQHHRQSDERHPDARRADLDGPANLRGPALQTRRDRRSAPTPRPAPIDHRQRQVTGSAPPTAAATPASTAPNAPVPASVRTHRGVNSDRRSTGPPSTQVYSAGLPRTGPSAIATASSIAPSRTATPTDQRGRASPRSPPAPARR